MEGLEGPGEALAATRLLLWLFALGWLERWLRGPRGVDAGGGCCAWMDWERPLGPSVAGALLEELVVVGTLAAGCGLYDDDAAAVGASGSTAVETGAGAGMAAAAAAGDRSAW